jgi:pyruvate dehydrogenase (quinone)
VAAAKSMGAAGFILDDPATVGQVLDQALAHPGPVIIEAVVDPDEIPVSPQHLN